MGAVLAGAVQVTVSEPLPPTAEEIFGAAGGFEVLFAPADVARAGIAAIDSAPETKKTATRFIHLPPLA